MSRFTLTFTHETSGGVEHEHTLPAVHEVCPRCEGAGTHLHEAIGGHAYTPEEFNEAFDDDEDRAEYFKPGGRYDVQCSSCGGRGLHLVVDIVEANRTAKGRRRLYLYEAIENRKAQDEAEQARERHYGY